jgi:uncharacterized protein (TIGR00266 family)
MKYEIKDRPSYALLEVGLEAGESIRAEAGAMTYMSPNVEIQTHMRQSSFWSALGLNLLGAQSFFVNEFKASGGGATLGLVSAPVGDMAQLSLAPGRGYVIQKAAYVASSLSVDLDIKWEGFTKGLFGQGLFMVKVTGGGDLFINAFGAIEKKTLAPDEHLVGDNFHLVAFTDTCRYAVKKFGGLKSTLLGGEGLVVDISGPGDIYLQTKNPGEFAEWLWTLLEPRVRARAR